ncbi:MAG: MFS transporter [Methanobacterium sp.]|nr:MAG: MFS transporter [Methanobacterium sp.]
MIVLVTLIMGAAVANLNLSVANVALPSIGLAFNASQVLINLVAVGYSLGLAASVLWFGAIGDHHGRKMMLLIGTFLAIPSSLLAGFAPSIEILIAARIFGGLAAGMAFPTTLALIAALWSGKHRTRSIALWSGVGAAVAALGPMISGFLLLSREWSSVFMVTIPIAVVALIMIYKFIPSHINETSDPVDNLGGILSLLLLGSLVLAINLAPLPGARTITAIIVVLALISGVFFIIRQRRVKNPLYDLKIARRPTFMVAAVAGTIVFGSLMGAMYIGQQFMQNVLSYSTLHAGIAILPGAVFMLFMAPFSARLVERYGSRFTLLLGFLFCLIGFISMLFLWKEGIPYWMVGISYALLGTGVGIAGTPASNSLTTSVPLEREGMASGTADLQRDLGGAIMTSIFGVLLTAGYSRAFSKLISGLPTVQQEQISSDVIATLLKSFSSAADIAQAYPQYQTQIIEAAKISFLNGTDWAHVAGIIAILIGAAIIYFKFPKKEEEKDLHLEYRQEDEGV